MTRHIPEMMFVCGIIALGIWLMQILIPFLSIILFVIGCVVIIAVMVISHAVLSEIELRRMERMMMLYAPRYHEPLPAPKPRAEIEYYREG